MNNRLVLKTHESQRKKEKLFCAFLTLGFPNLAATEKLIWEFEKMGVDILELGFPFSDPMADGPTIQYSSECALKNGVCMEDAFELVARVRRQGCKMPILFFTYLNPVFHYGIKRFTQQAQAAGFDGLIIPDAPPEEEMDLTQECRRRNLKRVYLVAPTTEKKRAALIAKQSEGFIYYVSLRGVTGARKALASDIRRNLKSLKKVAHKPVLIGFGVSSPEQSRSLGQMSEGVIVGSAIVEKLRAAKGNIKPAVHFVRQMMRALKS